MERNNYKKEIDAEKALEKLQILCARAEKSSADAIRLMYRWGVAKEQMEEVVQKLKKDRYIDDRRYVEAYVRDKSKFSSWGARKIADMLIMRGLDGDLVRDVVRNSASKDDISAKLSTLLSKKYIELSKKESDNYKIKNKLFGYAATKGYSFDEISDVIERIVVDNGSSEF